MPYTVVATRCDPRSRKELQKEHHRIYSAAYHKAKAEAEKSMSPDEAKEAGAVAAKKAVAKWKVAVARRGS